VTPIYTTGKATYKQTMVMMMQDWIESESVGGQIESVIFSSIYISWSAI
jgi:hypothetical protein